MRSVAWSQCIFCVRYCRFLMTVRGRSHLLTASGCANVGGGVMTPSQAHCSSLCAREQFLRVQIELLTHWVRGFAHEWVLKHKRKDNINRRTLHARARILPCKKLAKLQAPPAHVKNVRSTGHAIALSSLVSRARRGSTHKFGAFSLMRTFTRNFAHLFH